MQDFYEIDLINLDSKNSGDAIGIRYRLADATYIHVVDGGFQDTGAKVVEHINRFYDSPSFIDHVVATHPDGDHAGGLREVLQSFAVGNLWMFRPWNYAQDLIQFFPRFKSLENLTKRLRELYPNIDALEQIALEKGIPISEPTAGTRIGALTVLSPDLVHYLVQVIESDKTPESHPVGPASSTAAGLRAFGQAAVRFMRKLWGEEVFSPEETSAENEMSVVQHANLCGETILLTGDAGRLSLQKAANFAQTQGIPLPGVKRFQVPHHGSRRNLSTEVLDRWLGPRLPARGTTTTFTAMISASKDDKDHPRKAVVRACIHRGACVVSNQTGTLCVSKNAPDRGWITSTPLDYPEDQEQ